MQRLSSLENSVLGTNRTPSAVPDQEAEYTLNNATKVSSCERATKRKRTTSSIDGLVPIATPEVDVTQQPTNEARHLISKELSTNDLLSVHQRAVLETAISFVDHLSHAPVPTITDRSTFDKSMFTPSVLSPGEILHVILGSKLVSNVCTTLMLTALCSGSQRCR